MTYPSQQSVSPQAYAAGFEPTQVQAAPSQDALQPGARVAEYEVQHVLGEGGFGIVYLAVDHDLQRHVAVKEYLPAALASRGARSYVTLRASSHAETFALGLRSFVNEARLLARFDHPSLVRVYRFWEANGTAYMVMPYYEGPTLAAARMAMRTPPDEAWLRNLLESLMGALDVLHAASCYHRDIAPDNILLLTDGRPVLLDFGAARRVIGDKTQTLTAILKPAFAPIEQYAEAGHLQQGPWTDLYALAAVVYYCISGRSPLPSTVRAVDDQLQPLSEVVQSLQAVYPGLSYSAPFLAAIDWALSVRPQDRPQSVDELRQALNQAGPARDAAVAATAARRAATQRGPQDGPPVFTVFPGGAGATPGTPPPAAPPFTPQRPDEVPSDEAVMAALNVALGSLPPATKEDPERWTATRPGDEMVADGNAGGSGRLTHWALGFAVLVALGLGGWKWNEERKAAALMRQIAGTSYGQSGTTTPPPPAPRPVTPAAPGGGAAGETGPRATGTPPGAEATPPAAVAGVNRPPQQEQPTGVAPATTPPAATATPPSPTATTTTPPAAAGTVSPPAPTVAATPPATPPAVTPPAATPPATTAATTAATPAPPPAEPTPAAPGAVAATPTPGPGVAAGTPPPGAEAGANPNAPGRRVAATEPSNPRALCEPRTNFSLYYCMQTQCKKGQYLNHPQCVRLRAQDEVDE
ncbi:serine/threonine protein kinase [Caldimonas brevitalea]|uniref:non-specific serine/threonine protein kinase n=1 Tax=Caldimonas brevitalea TaxID=413882 RepID=A0A0G3BS50_9BURK|nr:serine/threonine-protein kinase [Caldimonas brevitalea]AKJ29335.1 serine/threonine protein kinase [Caldimonas brevitalea]